MIKKLLKTDEEWKLTFKKWDLWQEKVFYQSMKQLHLKGDFILMEKLKDVYYKLKELKKQ